MATITISVNVSQAKKWEGNAEYQVTIPEAYLDQVSADSFSKEIELVIGAAIENYTSNNETEGEQMHADWMDEQQSYRELARGE